MDTIKATNLRANLYSYLDRVLETGEPLEIERKGRRLRIGLAAAPKKTSATLLQCLEPHPDYILGDDAGLVSVEWLGQWKPYT